MLEWMLIGWQCLKMECHPMKVETLKVNDGGFFSINVGNCSFLIVFASILCVWVKTSVFNYVRCKATINYKSVFLMAELSSRARKGRTSPERCVAIVCPELLRTFLKCPRCPTERHRCALSQSDKYVKTSYLCLNRLIVC